MYTITKEFHFSASHQLCGLPDDHPCARLHGHNYIAEVELRAEALDENGFVLDYRALKPLKTWIDDHLDHRHLNEVFGHDHVTSEVLAKEIFDWARARWEQVSAVRISETPKTWAEYRPLRRAA
ncbi:6-pyruvoyl trahydropterin synthase family protein [Limimaricola sp.]|uniref:6-pyruvoyl trahydropterin synthase family protein n=1 Tax=Limimaricola sp. TaxID=2211665 RepID=UPI004058A262